MDKILNEELSDETKKINETIINVQPSLSTRITNSIYYTKLKYLMFNEIVKFCKEKVELKQDLLGLRTYIGDFWTEEMIINEFDTLKTKYNNGAISDIGLEYHIESTKLDFGVCLFAIIKRGDTVYTKKFIFRFRKTSTAGFDISNLTVAGVPLPDQVKQDVVNLGGNENV